MLGIAMMGTVSTLVYRHRLGASEAAMPDPAARLAEDSLANALRQASAVGGSDGATLASEARAAFASSFSVTMCVAAVLLIAGAVLVRRMLPGPPPTPAGSRVESAR